MRDRINAMVKMREAFRPFAPAVTIEEAKKWFYLGQDPRPAVEFEALGVNGPQVTRSLTGGGHMSQPLTDSYVAVTSIPRAHLTPCRNFPFMIATVDVRPEYRAELPAVTHVNGSARLQTVSEADNLDFHTLLKAVGAATGREMVLNTSFNVKGQPIVNTPAEAIETFLSTGIDYLFIENLLISRPRLL